MRLWWLVLTGVGLGVLALSILPARAPSIGPVERRVFHAINRWPGWLYPVLWLPMQLGNLVVGTAAGVVVAARHRDLGVAIGVAVAMSMKLVTERVVRKEMAGALAIRQRPGTSQVGAILRGGDVPVAGPSFPSGHVILVASVACVVAGTIPVAWWWVLVLLTAAVMVGRVYVGAHNPLDVTAGLGAGLLAGGIVAAIFN
jgi:membrane-associated phospholipid phosphatase